MPRQDVPGAPDVPEVATCVVCEVAANTSELSMSAFPDGEYRWVCRDFHACARNVAASQDLRAGRKLHDDLDPAYGAAASPRHLELRAARLRGLSTERGT